MPDDRQEEAAEPTHLISYPQGVELPQELLATLRRNSWPAEGMAWPVGTRIEDIQTPDLPLDLPPAAVPLYSSLVRVQGEHAADRQRESERELERARVLDDQLDAMRLAMTRASEHAPIVPPITEQLDPLTGLRTFEQVQRSLAAERARWGPMPMAAAPLGACTDGSGWPNAIQTTPLADIHRLYRTARERMANEMLADAGVYLDPVRSPGPLMLDQEPEMPVERPTTIATSDEARASEAARIEWVPSRVFTDPPTEDSAEAYSQTFAGMMQGIERRITESLLVRETDLGVEVPPEPPLPEGVHRHGVNYLSPDSLRSMLNGSVRERCTNRLPLCQCGCDRHVKQAGSRWCMGHNARKTEAVT